MNFKYNDSARKRARSITALALTMGLSLSLLTGCGNTAVSDSSAGASVSAESASDALQSDTAQQTSAVTAVSGQRLDVSDLFSDRDLSGDWDESQAVSITLNGDSAESDSANVTVDGSTVTITGEGVYVLSGTLKGQIVVDAEGAKVQLVLKGATITSDSSAAVYVKQADKVFLTLAQGTENTLSTTGAFVQSDDNKVDAVVFSKDDLTLNGTGSLTVTTENGHGIVSKDELTLAGVTLTVSASGHALSGKDSVCVASGTYTLTAGKDGIHSENADDASKGYIVIEDGSFTINAEGDGLDASNVVQLDGGKLDITAGGGSANAEQKHQEFFGHREFQQTAGQTIDQSTAQSTDESAAQSADQSDTQSGDQSAKGVKADLTIFLAGAELTVDSADDAVHANDDVEVSGGTLNLTTGDDGIHADAALVISDGKVTIPSSYEGLEGKTITVSGGTIDLTASDDGLNAAGGNDGSGTQGPMGGFDQFAAQEGVSITISGGTLTVNAEGDGLDSNGDLVVTGGDVVVYGPLNSGNGAIDHNGAATISGGTLIALSRSGMEEGFDESSEQGTIAVTLDSAVTGTLKLTGSNGQTVLECSSEKEFSVVQLSAAALKSGETYTLTAGDQSVTIEMDSLHYGQLTGMGGGSMGGHGPMGDQSGSDQGGKGSMGGQDSGNGNGQGGPMGRHGGKGGRGPGKGGFGGSANGAPTPPDGQAAPNKETDGQDTVSGASVTAAEDESSVSA